MTTTKQLKHMTQYQRIAAGQKVVRLTRINQYYKDNQDASINRAVTFIPESASLVQQHSKLRREKVIEGDHDEITPEDIHESMVLIHSGRGGDDINMKVSKPTPKTLNEKRSYNMVPAAPKGVVLIFSATPSTIHYERMGAKL